MTTILQLPMKGCNIDLISLYCLNSDQCVIYFKEKDCKTQVKGRLLSQVEKCFVDHWGKD